MDNNNPSIFSPKDDSFKFKSSQNDKNSDSMYTQQIEFLLQKQVS